MDLRIVLLVAATSVALTTGYAVAENSQQAKMKSCNAAAKQKALKGADREALPEDLLVCWR